MRKHNDVTSDGAGNKLKYDTCGKPHETEDCWYGANAANYSQQKRKYPTERQTETNVKPTTSTLDEEPKN